MKLITRFGTCLTALLTCGVLGVAVRGAEPKDALGWNPQAAATYLDGRATFWATWPNAARDHGTFCISCHTTLPFAIARPALRGLLGERVPGAAETKILENLLTRACGWRIQNPYQPGRANELNELASRMPRVFIEETRTRPGSIRPQVPTSQGPAIYVAHTYAAIGV